jgi:hypothetical protein
MSRSLLTSLLFASSALLLSGCNEDPVETEEPELFVWEARDIVSNGSTNIAFNASAYLVASGGLVDTGIRITGAEWGTEFGWLIRGGTCGSGGPLLSSDPTAFPMFTIEPDGVGQVAKSVFGFLEGTEQFYVEIYLDPQSGLNLVGCGPMILLEDLDNF